MALTRTPHGLAVAGNKQRGVIEARLFMAICKQHGVVPPVVEWRFAQDIGRQWAFDFAWPESHVALEVEGGIFIGGAHNRGAHFASDMQKYNEAAAHGWYVIRCIPGDKERIGRDKKTGNERWRVAGLLHLDTVLLVKRILARPARVLGGPTCG